jgi:hypothetical protein
MGEPSWGLGLIDKNKRSCKVPLHVNPNIFSSYISIGVDILLTSTMAEWDMWQRTN